MKRAGWLASVLALLLVAVGAQFYLKSVNPSKSPAMSESAFAALGGFRSLAAEIIWFRADRLQDEGRYVEMAQLASTLTLMEPHTPEVWSYAAWNLAYNISVMMPTEADRWRWVQAGIRLLRDEGLRLNPGSKEICRELAWMFELKIGANLDTAAPYYRRQWKAIIEDATLRGSWSELGMRVEDMRRIEALTGFKDWTDPQLSAIYWAAQGGCADIVRQASIIYRRSHKL